MKKICIVEVFRGNVLKIVLLFVLLQSYEVLLQTSNVDKILSLETIYWTKPLVKGLSGQI